MFLFSKKFSRLRSTNVKLLRQIKEKSIDDGDFFLNLEFLLRAAIVFTRLALLKILAMPVDLHAQCMCNI